MPCAGLKIAHTHGTRAFEQDLVDKGAGDQAYITTRHGRPQIGVRRRPSPTLPHRHVGRAKPLLTVAVVIRRRGIPGGLGRRDKGIMKRIVARPARHMQWPVGASPRRLAAVRCLHPPKIGQHVGITPAIGA